MKFYVWDDKTKKYIDNNNLFSNADALFNFIRNKRVNQDEYIEIIKELYYKTNSSDKHIFTLDGTLDIENYINQSTRIMFLLKEAYDSTKIEENGLYIWDELTWARENAETLTNLTWKRIFQWSYLILNGEKQTFDEIIEYSKQKDERRKLLDNIAIINIKKFDGQNPSCDTNLKSIVEKEKEIIKKQINFFDPTIIICGHTGWLLDIVLDDNLRKVKNPNWLYDYNGKQVIDFWHPSCIKKDINLLSALKNILDSKLQQNDDDNTIK